MKRAEELTRVRVIGLLVDGCEAIAVSSSLFQDWEERLVSWFRERGHTATVRWYGYHPVKAGCTLAFETAKDTARGEPYVFGGL